MVWVRSGERDDRVWEIIRLHSKLSLLPEDLGDDDRNWS